MLIALNYHRIGEVPAYGDIWNLSVTPENFAAHLRVIKQIAKVADPRRECLVDLSRSSSKWILVTFDDGYVDNVDIALPILEKYQMPAVLFLSSGFVGSPLFWWDGVEAAAAGSELVQPLNSSSESLESLWSCLLKQGPDSRQTAAINLLRLRLNARIAKGIRPMTREEVQRLAHSDLVSFGGHTRWHPWLPEISLEDVYEEVTMGAQENWRLTERGQVAFAYPFGAWSKEVRQIVGDANFRLAFTTAAPLARVAHDPLSHPRLVVGNWCGAEFAARLHSLLGG